MLWHTRQKNLRVNQTLETNISNTKYNEKSNLSIINYDNIINRS